MSKPINIIELFSGIGGFTKGFIDAGYTINKHYYSEIDKHAIANYKNNFKHAEYIGSVTDVRGNRIEQPDIITFGSPCQDFSLAGNRAGMEGQRSSLILEAIRIVTEYKPSVFIWENVKGAFSSNNGADFWAIVVAFANIGGYRLEWQLLNTSWFLPQNRERIYLVGHLAGRSEPRVFPIGETNAIYIESNKDKEKIYTNNRPALTQQARQYSSWNGDFIKIKQINDKQNFGKSTKQQDRVYDSSGLMVCLPSAKTECKVNILVSSNTKKGYDVATENDSINLSVPTSKTRRGRVGVGVAQTLDTQCNQGVIVKPVLTPNRLEKRQNGRRFKEDGEDAFTLSCQDQHGVMINNNIRRLTEIECERLQGFPDDWTKYGIYTDKQGNEVIKEIPKTQRYKMCGNAVTTNVVKAIAERLKII